MSSGLVNAWDVREGDVLVIADRSNGAFAIHRYRVIEVPTVVWQLAHTAVRCSEGGMLTSFLLGHDERVLVIRQTDNHSRRAWTRRKELQS